MTTLAMHSAVTVIIMPARCSTNQKNKLSITDCEDLLVIALADAGAEPDAVVVESEHAVVAHMAVRGARRTEDAARFAELKLEQNGALSLGYLERLHPRRLGYVAVFVRQGAAFYIPLPTWHNAGVGGGGSDQEYSGGNLQIPR